MRLSFLLIVLTVTLAGSSHASSNLAKVSAIASTQHNQLEHGATRLLRFAETKEEVDDGDLDDDDDDDQGAESEERLVDVKSGVNWVTTKVGNLGSSVKNLMPSWLKLGGAKSSVVSGGDDVAAKVAANLKTGDDAVTKVATNAKTSDDAVTKVATNLKTGDEAVTKVATTNKRFFINDGYSSNAIKKKKQLLEDLKIAGVDDTALKSILTKTKSETNEISEYFKVHELKTKLENLQTAMNLLPRRNKAQLNQLMKSQQALSDAKRKATLVTDYARLQKKLV